MYGRCFPLSKGDGIPTRAVEPRAVRIEVLVVVLGFVRCVDEDVRLCNRRAREIVGAEGGFVGDRAPAMRKLLTPVAELEERGDQLFIGLPCPLDHGRFDLRVTLGSLQYCPNLRIP